MEAKNGCSGFIQSSGTAAYAQTEDDFFFTTKHSWVAFIQNDRPLTTLYTPVLYLT